tara:strand:- start:74 stop:598 length:525 start_codon:yes stop_codon:yes gene_type:complete
MNNFNVNNVKFNVIDNLLNDDDLNNIKNIMKQCPLHYSNDVAEHNDGGSYWNYYFTHLFYEDDRPRSEYFDQIYNIFIPKFKQYGYVKSLLRIKLNFYPYTETLREHDQHIDDEFTHIGAVFSLNTCDGFTRLHDGTKIDSIENRILFFDPSMKHNSSTTTNSCGRWNINFNFV